MSTKTAVRKSKKTLVHSDLNLPDVNPFLSQEDLAEKVADKIASDAEQESFRKSIDKLVRHLVRGYHNRTLFNCDSEDLVQECWSQILLRLHTFDKSKAKLTTWTYFVCRSVLNRKFGLDKPNFAIKHVSVHDNIPTRHEQTELKVHIRLAIQDLFTAYPKHKTILTTIFGDPFGDDYHCPDKINCNEIAKSLNVDSSSVYSFYKQDVKPFLRARLERA